MLVFFSWRTFLVRFSEVFSNVLCNPLWFSKCLLCELVLAEMSTFDARLSSHQTALIYNSQSQQELWFQQAEVQRSIRQATPLCGVQAAVTHTEHHRKYLICSFLPRNHLHLYISSLSLMHDQPTMQTKKLCTLLNPTAWLRAHAATV